MVRELKHITLVLAGNMKDIVLNGRISGGLI